MSDRLPKTKRRGKVWAGSTPKACDLCPNVLDKHFVDGVVKGQGWAKMCLLCHATHGVGLGTGRGQLFRLESDGQWVKIEG